MKKEKKIQSVLRSLDLLKALSENESGMGVGTAAELLGITAPAAHCLLHTLQSRGFVEKRGTNYQLGGEIVSLHNQYINTARLKKVKGLMLSLAEEYPESTINYTEVKSSQLMTILRITPQWPSLVQTLNSTQYNIYVNLTGMLFAALLPQEDTYKLRQFYSFERLGAPKWKTLKAYEEYIDKIKVDGYVFCNYPEENVFRTAVPIINSHKNLLGVLGLSIHIPHEKSCPNAKEGFNITKHILQKSGEIK